MSVCRTCAGYGYARGGQCWNCKGSGSEPETAGAEAPSVVGAEARDFLEFLACYNDGTTAHARSKKWPKWSRECDLLVRGSIGKSWLADTARNVLAALSPQALGEDLGSSPKAGLPTEGQDAPVVGWQPIETAPRNGDDILVVCGPDYDPMYGVASWEDGGWQMWWEKADAERHSWPTHWMPLPPAPSPTAGDE